MVQEMLMWMVVLQVGPASAGQIHRFTELGVNHMVWGGAHWSGFNKFPVILVCAQICQLAGVQAPDWAMVVFTAKCQVPLQLAHPEMLFASQLQVTYCKAQSWRKRLKY